MENKINKLKDKGLSYREIAKELNISLGKVQRIVKKIDTPDKVLPMDNTDTPDTAKESIQQTDTANRTDKGDYTRLGVKKLRKSDYTEEELKIFPDAPYYD